VTVADVPEIVHGLAIGQRVERLVLTSDDLAKEWYSRQGGQRDRSNAVTVDNECVSDIEATIPGDYPCILHSWCRMTLMRGSRTRHGLFSKSRLLRDFYQ